MCLKNAFRNISACGFESLDTGSCNDLQIDFLNDTLSKQKLNEEKTISLKKEQDELCKQKNSSKNIGVALGIIAIICIIAGIGTFITQMVQVSIVAFVVRNYITRFNIYKNKFFSRFNSWCIWNTRTG